MSSTPGRSNLSLNLRGPSVNFFGSQDLYGERNWLRAQNYVIEELDLTPTVTGNFAPGTQAVVEYDKRGDLGGHQELIWTRSQLTGGVNARYNDFEAPAAMEHIDIWYGNRILHTVYGEQIFYEQMEEDNDTELLSKAKRQHGLLTQAERVLLNSSAGATPVVNKLDLRLPWYLFLYSVIVNLFYAFQIIFFAVLPLSFVIWCTAWTAVVHFISFTIISSVYSIVRISFVSTQIALLLSHLLPLFSCDFYSPPTFIC